MLGIAISCLIVSHGTVTGEPADKGGGVEAGTANGGSIAQDRELLAKVNRLREDLQATAKELADVKANAVGILRANAFGKDKHIALVFGDWPHAGFFVETGSLEPAVVTLAEDLGLEGTKSVFARPMTVNGKQGVRVVVLGIARDPSVADDKVGLTVFISQAGMAMSKRGATVDAVPSTDF